MEFKHLSGLPVPSVTWLLSASLVSFPCIFSSCFVPQTVYVTPSYAVLFPTLGPVSMVFALTGPPSHVSSLYELLFVTQLKCHLPQETSPTPWLGHMPLCRGSADPTIPSPIALSIIR